MVIPHYQLIYRSLPVENSVSDDERESEYFRHREQSDQTDAAGLV